MIVLQQCQGVANCAKRSTNKANNDECTAKCYIKGRNRLLSEQVHVKTEARVGAGEEDEEARQGQRQQSD
jgi:hypothetical protein